MHGNGMKSVVTDDWWKNTIASGDITSRPRRACRPPILPVVRAGPAMGWKCLREHLLFGGSGCTGPSTAVILELTGGMTSGGQGH